MLLLFRYGLILPEKRANLQALKPAAFQSDSDSDSNSRPNVPTLAEQSVIKPKDLSAQQKAIQEDPTVYQYDEIYDKIETKKQESKLARKDVDKKPKYISKLLQSANRRKRENELRIERQVQKDRVAEGDEFKDKEEFVTSAYKKKLEELRELEEQEKREEYLEQIGDVTKQSDLGGFYRHLYEQQVKNEEVEVKTEQVADDSKDLEKDLPKKEKKSRKYRARDEKNSSDSDEPKEVKKSKTHLPSNLDADSDFSIESSDDEDTKEEKEVEKKIEVVEIKEEPKEKEVKVVVKETPLEFEPEIKEEEKPVVKKVKVDIWKKRTVGTVFDEAVKRYYERKAERNSSG